MNFTPYLKTKNLFTLTIFALLLTGLHYCESDLDRGFGPYTVTIEGNDLIDGVRSYMTIRKNGNELLKDSSIVSKNKIVFKGQCDSLELVALEIEGITGRFPLILAPGETRVVLNRDTINLSVASGNMPNEDFMRYKEGGKANNMKMKDISLALRAAKTANDSIALDSLQPLYQETIETFRFFPYNFIEQNPDSDMCLLMLDEMVQGRINPSLLDRVKSSYDALAATIKKNEINQRRGQRIKAAIDLMEKTKTGAGQQ